METDTRSVAEIIGWTLEHVPDLDGGTDPMWRCPDGCRPERDDGCWGHARPSVIPDDMLAWLRGHGHDVDINAPHDDEVEVNVGEPGAVMVPFYDSTIHAALEAAVRAVAT